MFFGNLRTTPFNPTFEWVATTREAADKINLPHEDYPKYVKRTEKVLSLIECSEKIYRWHLTMVHGFIFGDKSFKGQWRKVDVRVGLHHPPTLKRVPELMAMLEKQYSIKTIEDLIEWYKDFEAIHPFQDGNGRVGGVVVAAYAHKLHPEKGWLAPNQ